MENRKIVGKSKITQAHQTLKHMEQIHVCIQKSLKVIPRSTGSILIFILSKCQLLIGNYQLQENTAAKRLKQFFYFESDFSEHLYRSQRLAQGGLDLPRPGLGAESEIFKRTRDFHPLKTWFC